jgi:transcriptional regulator with XRE-family HTH domain
MRKISDKPPASANRSPVAHYIDLQLEAIRPQKTQAQVADEAGFPQRNLLSMIRSGQTRLPLERIRGLAKALEINQNHLFRLALQEYQPHIKELFDEAGQQAISKYERQLLEVWRQATGDEDPPVEPVAHEIESLGRRALDIEKETAHSTRRRDAR